MNKETMQKYIRCHMVEAEPMTAYEFDNLKNREHRAEENQKGYHVFYPDGYDSWCPKAQFESASRLVDGMTFGQAIELMKRGKKVARRGWNGKGMWLCIPLCDGPKEIPASSIWGKPNAEYAEQNGGTVKVVPYITMKAADGTIVMGWLASQTDMLSEDWVVVEDEPDTIRIEAGVRYPEDGYINGVRDDNDSPKMPFLVPDPDSKGEWRWNLDINIATGQVVNWPKDVVARVHYKVCDCCRIKYGDKIYEDYVPRFLSIDDEGYGDYVILTIQYGFISNWSTDLCGKFIKECLPNN